jgi:hypothetical protein
VGVVMQFEVCQCCRLSCTDACTHGRCADLCWSLASRGHGSMSACLFDDHSQLPQDDR